jgi:hypothetical protein
MTTLNRTTQTSFARVAGEYPDRFGGRMHFDGGESEAEKQAAAKAIADKAAADKVIADAAAAAEKVAADKAAADKILADKAVADAAAAELAKKLSTMTDSEAKLLKENMAAKAKVAAAEAAVAEANERLKAFEGLDPKKVAELVAAAATAEAAKVAAEKAALVKAGDFERLQEMMKTEHQAEVGVVKAEVTTTKTALDVALKTIDDLTVGSAFDNSKFVADELVLTPSIARNEFGTHFDVVNGQTIAFDKPRGAEGRTKLVNGSGDAISFEDAIRKLVDARSDKDKILRSGLKPGARSSTTTTTVKERLANGGAVDETRGAARMALALSKGALKKAK